MPFVLHATVLVSILALAVYFWSGMRVAMARSKYGVEAPAVEGPEPFNRIFRAQQNTMEQLVLFLPALWFCYILFHSIWPAIFALLWPLGRVIYVLSYSRSASARGPGFLLSAIAMLGLLIAALVGSVLGFF